MQIRNTSGLRTGRPKGAKNKRTQLTLETQEFWREFLSSPRYRASAEERVLKGTAPHLENFWHAKLNGKPPEHLTIAGDPDRPLTMKVTFELHRPDPPQLEARD